MVRRLRNLPGALVAIRRERNGVPARSGRILAEQDLRTAAAELLGLDPQRLGPETRFIEDLKVPPGEFLDRLGELEERFGIDLSEKEVRTFGDLLDGVDRRHD